MIGKDDISDLNVEFDEVDGELGGGVEGGDGVLLHVFHPPIRRLHYVHAASSVSHHHELFLHGSHCHIIHTFKKTKLNRKTWKGMEEARS